MSKKNLQMIVPLLIVLLLTACARKTGEPEQAQEALGSFFTELSSGRYEAATRWYGGSYEILVGYNPEVDPENFSALWQQGCQINGLHCLPLRTVTFNERTSKGEYIFTVEFNTPDGALFVLDACCGEEPTTPPQFQFEYRVVKGGDGVFRVLDLPVYVP